ncbi:unnamed protein product [Cladocopium goreaui]|uniref:Fe2OG dioxygenase domain-containing protein n=1 Tax=Cladocopium goreaui TaxID=2562237 RepID=A0A9P1CI89_9DINO|nr:unnamed protein product [Cladocopium goreaui]
MAMQRCFATIQKRACRHFRSTADSVAGLAKAKEKIDGQSASWVSVLKSAVPFLLTAGAGTATWAFYDGLWVPLLRDGQTASEVELISKGLLPESLICWAAERLIAKEVVVLDGVVPPEQLRKIQEELQLLASRPGALQPNPKMKAGNMQIRTDRVCYLRDPSSFVPLETGGPALCGPELRWCHRRLRSTAAQLERGYAAAGSERNFLVTAWTQLAQYTEGSGFYKWHTDGLDGSWSGILGWYFWLQRGAVRRRSVTGILYLNEEDWPKSAGGALRCKAHAAVHRGPVESHPPITEILPKGGRLVLFDSHSVEHEVVSTNRDRWALTAWFHE